MFGNMSCGFETEEGEVRTLYSLFFGNEGCSLRLPNGSPPCTPTLLTKPSTVSGICMSETIPKKTIKSGEALLEKSQNLTFSVRWAVHAYFRRYRLVILCTRVQ